MLTEELLALLKLFETYKNPLTARKIADKLKTYPATALRRVESLREHLSATGNRKQIKKVKFREGRRGPASTAWVLT